MKKTAIVSCYFQHNYGSMLQAYATQMALDKLGYENETIDISGFNGEIKKAKLLYFAKASLTSDILLSKLGMARNVLIKKFSKNQYAQLSKVRSEKFDAYKYSTMNVITDRNHGNYHQGVESDPWLRAFFSNICDRPSCHFCHFRKQYRVSDFTIWDCFNVGRFSKELDNDKGATRVLVHTEKGREIFNAIKDDFSYIEIAPEAAVAGAKEMKESVLLRNNLIFAPMKKSGTVAI